MKLYFLLAIFTLFSCEQKDTTTQDVIKNEEKKVRTTKSTSLEEISSTEWFQYYKSLNLNFRAERFQLQTTSEINYQSSNVITVNQKNFDKVYLPFLVYNKSKTQYLDFDSYQWVLLEDGSAAFEADQPIALINVNNNEARQIAFFGPSYWIEDAYWKEDSAVVLLGNSYDKVPFVMKYNFDKNTVQNYKYTDTLKFKTNYTNIRLNKKGIKTQ